MSAFAPPPPYEQSCAKMGAADNIDQIASERNRVMASIIARESSMFRDVEVVEAARLRNFLLFTLVRDYKCHGSQAVTLSAADMEHFTTLASIFKLRVGADRKGKVPQDEALGTDVYMRQCLHEPCAVLGLELESVWLAICRWARFTNLHGMVANDDQMTMLFREDPDRLARKLYADRTTLIPTLATSTALLHDLLEGVDNVSNLFFVSVVKMDLSSVPTRCGYMTDVQYLLTSHGRRIKEYNDSVKESSYTSLSPQHWLARFKFFTEKRARTSKH